jgi:hypothetical protein
VPAAVRLYSDLKTETNISCGDFRDHQSQSLLPATANNAKTDTPMVVTQRKHRGMLQWASLQTYPQCSPAGAQVVFPYDNRRLGGRGISWLCTLAYTRISKANFTVRVHVNRMSRTRIPKAIIMYYQPRDKRPFFFSGFTALLVRP